MRHDGRKHSESTREPWGYRPHLDGLRSIAVYLVVLFHAGSAKFIGGFVGVDLFFVLSGFLVTNVILSDLAEYGSIRISRFYARRARRLIPAAAAAVIGTSLGALLIANPLDRAAFGDDARAASPWFANWHFIREANDYFNVDDAPSPFLHFWSLAIEEQFYLMFPVLLMVVWVLSRRRLGVMLGAFASLLVAMIVVQVAWASRDANRAHLGTDARAYQLLAGVVLALLLWKFAIPDVTRVPGRWVFPLAVVGLVVIASWMTDLSASRRGLLAAACSVVIIASAEAAGGGWLARVLGWRPIRYLGGISYGTYLWHWPVLVLVQRVVDVTPFAAFVLSASLGTALAALSFELIEQPVRRARQLDARPRMAIAAGVVLAAVTGLVIAPTMLNNDRPPAVTAPSVGAGITPVPDLDWAAINENVPRIPRCKADDGSDCIAVKGDRGTMMLIGDSHAHMLVPVFEQVARAHGFRLVVSHAGTCPWPEFAYLGPLDNERTQQCIDERDRVYGTLIPALDPDIVVMASRGRQVDSGLVLGATRPGLEGLSTQELMSELATATVDQLTVEGRFVVLMEPVVETEDDPLTCLSGAQYVEQCVFPAVFGTTEEPLYRSLDDASDQVVSIDLDASICPGLVLCPPIIDGVVVRRDNNHLSVAFAEWLAESVDAQLVEAGVLPAVQR